MNFYAHMNEQSFNWLTWRNGSIVEILGIAHRTAIILNNKHIIRKWAIGYCKADNIPCRPKQNQIAVMFCTDGINNWWTHLRRVKFDAIFPECELF